MVLSPKAAVRHAVEEAALPGEAPVIVVGCGLPGGAYKHMGGEGNSAVIDVAIALDHLTLAAGYGHFGNVLNHEANGVWGITTKWEF